MKGFAPREIRSKRSSRVLAFVVGGIMLIASTGEAGVITFDDIFLVPAFDSFIPITNGYQSLNWDNFYAMYGPGLPLSGFDAGLISGTNDAFNAFGSPANISSTAPFTLTSGYFTGAWNDGLDILVQGLIGASVVDSTVLVVSATAPTLETFDWSGLTEVEFSASGGNVDPQWAATGGPGPLFVIDNLVINGTSASPEPSSFGLIGIGLVVVAIRRPLKGAHSR